MTLTLFLYPFQDRLTSEGLHLMSTASLNGRRDLINFKTRSKRINDQAIDDERDAVPIEVVAEEIVVEEAVDGDDGELVLSDGDMSMLKPEVVAQEGVFSTDDGDVIPDELYTEVVAQEGVRLVDDGDVIPNEVVVEEMLEDHINQ
ncbi:hypothetical protein Tco_0569662 [Tanacetum coccineum]